MARQGRGEPGSYLRLRLSDRDAKGGQGPQFEAVESTAEELGRLAFSFCSLFWASLCKIVLADLIV